MTAAIFRLWQVGITLYLLYTEVSFAFIAGLAVIVLMIPVNSVIAKVGTHTPVS